MHLIADIGGTNIRLAAFHGDPLIAFDQLMTGTCDKVRNYSWDQVGRLNAAIQDFQDHFHLPGRAQSLTIAIAGIALVDQEEFGFTNRDAGFCRSDLYEFADTVEIINDFAAQASAIPHLGEDHFSQVKPGQRRAGARAVVGPGTGLGIAGLTPGGLVIPGEGGNVAVTYLPDAPLSRIEANVDRGQLRAEDVFSGQGLENIFQAQSGCRMAAQEISARAHRGDAQARQALDLFFDYAAQISANQALQYVAVGGVYLVGSIMIKNADLLDLDRFASVFCSIKTHEDFLRQIPVYLVTSATSGLAGVAAYLASC